MSDANERARWLIETVGVRALSDHAVIRVHGEEARSWLNGQLTNDVGRLAPGQSAYGLAVDVRGKILADVWVLHRGEELLLVVPAAARETLLGHFDDYIVMEDVELEAADWAVLTAQGPKAAAVAEAVDAIGSRCDRLGSGGVDLLVAPAHAGAALARSRDEAERLGGGAVDDEAWELARLRAGVPRFGLDFGAANYPQEAGLKERAVSFDKGCYLGQEVVCMLENRGQLRRRLVRLEGPDPVPPGAPIEADGATVGEVTSATVDPRDGIVRALGYLKRAFAEPGREVSTAAGPLRVAGVVGGAASG